MGSIVYDDYAHNPAKIRASWQTAAERHARVLGVWRPHGYGPLRAMAGDLQEVFGEVVRPEDRLYVLPVYYAGGTAETSMTSTALVARLTEAGVPAAYVPGYEELKPILASAAAVDAAVLVMGARDPDLPLFARGLVDAAGMVT